jgi:hypothetical protein
VIIAAQRRHPQLVPIVLITIFTSWTVIGWLIALVWSVASFRREVRAPPSGSPTV